MNNNFLIFFRLIKDFLTYFIKIRIWNLLGYNTYAKIFQRLVLKQPNKIAFKHEDSLWSYIEVMNKYNNCIKISSIIFYKVNKLFMM